MVRHLPHSPEELRHPASYAVAYTELAPTAFATANRVLHDAAAAEDVVQDVFTALWLKPSAFDPRRGSLRTYVAVMARSRAVDRVRTRTAGEAATRRIAADAGGTTGEDPADAAARREVARRLLKATANLPQAQRDAVLACRVGGMTEAQLADAAQLPVGTAKSRVRLGLAKLRAQLA